MITEVFIENQRLDISEDISSLLTFALDDVRDFSSRQTTFSKTIILPGTARNNMIFANAFEVSLNNNHDDGLPNVGLNFNQSKSAACIIFQDYMQTFKGAIRLLEIILDNGRPEYQVCVSGDITTLNAALSGTFLTDLDFSAYNRNWTVDNIVNSWDNTPGSGLYFPLIDYGTYSVVKHNWNFRAFRPALYVKEYIDKIFSAAGFRYNCALFNTDRFKRLVIPHNQKDLVKLTGNILNAVADVNQHIINHTTGPNAGDAHFGSIIGGLFTSADGKTFQYVGTDTITPTMNVDLHGVYNMKAIVPPGINFEIRITIQKNGSTYYFDGFPLSNNSGVDTAYNKSWSVPITLAQNDTFSIHFALFNGPGGPADCFLNSGFLQMVTDAVVTSPVDYNEEIDLSFAIPQNIKQVDFLVSIVKLFNLYVYEDKYDNRLINIAPFVDFYPGSVIDWSRKMNRVEVISIKPMSELNSKLYNFNYASDSDYYNDLYQKRYNQGYGSYIFDTEFEFATETNKLTLIFAPTPLVGYQSDDKVYPTIFKLSGTTEDRTDSVIRIMQTRKIHGVDSWKMLRVTEDVSTSLGSFTDYGYAGHYDDPVNPDNDLNFGGLQEIFFRLNQGTLDRTQFNMYWSSYMAEITDKDSKLLSAKFKLDPIDILNLDFSKFIYLDGVLWRLNKIADYNASIPSDCTVELLKVINTAYSYPIGSPPEEDRELEWSPGEAMEYSPGNAMLYE